MKVAVINTFDARDITVWSGIPFHISLLLDSIFNDDIKYIKLPPMRRSFSSYTRGFYLNRIKKKRYYTWADEKTIDHNKNMVDNFLEEKYDVIITFQFYLVPLLKKQHNKVIHWNDANFKNLNNFYAGYSNFSNYSLKAAHAIQKKALDLSNIIIYTSDWAIESAVTYYNTDRKKLRKILFASNFRTSLSQNDIEPFIKDRKIDVVNLLFVGADWERKGGSDAIEVLNSLNKRGIKSILYVVGADIPEHYSNNENIIPIGFIDKGSVEGEKILVDLFRKSTYLLLPSRVDLTPVVFSEANSFALPVLTIGIGGIPSVIEKNINGCYFDATTFVENVTDFVINTLPTSQRYNDLCYSSFQYYRDNMSWEQVKIKFIHIMKDLQIQK